MWNFVQGGCTTYYARKRGEKKLAPIGPVDWADFVLPWNRWEINRLAEPARVRRQPSQPGIVWLASAPAFNLWPEIVQRAKLGFAAEVEADV
jgi:hypothetical protein